MTSTYGLPSELLTTVAAVVAGNDRVEEALLFGSRAKGVHRPGGSDIDIAPKGPELQLRDMLQPGIALDALETPYQFDLVIYHRITEPDLRDHIDRQGTVLYQRVRSTVLH